MCCFRKGNLLLKGHDLLSELGKGSAIHLSRGKRLFPVV